LDLAAYSVLVEEISLRALEAGVGAPYFASEVVIELHKEGSVVELLRAKCQ